MWLHKKRAYYTGVLPMLQWLLRALLEPGRALDSARSSHGDLRPWAPSAQLANLKAERTGNSPASGR